MADRAPEDSLVELRNPIVKRAYWMIGEQLPVETAVEALLNDEQLQSEPDDELIRIIEEADRFWRGQCEDCVRKPGSIEMYAPLMTACCKQRYDSLWELRKAASAGEQAALTARMGRLMTVRAHCELASAESLLLNEKYREAYEAFGRAEWAARAVPDEGSLRLCEILWARYGQWATASRARRPNETASAEAGINQLLQGAGPAAEECLRKVEQIFSRHHWVFSERDRLRRELKEHPAQPGKPPAEAPSAAGSLLELVSGLAAGVRSGQMTMEEARERAGARFPSLGLQPGMVGVASGMFETLVATDPERAVLLAEINCELALQFQDQPELQSGCLGSLAFALNHLPGNQPAGFQRAIEVLDRAYELVKSSRDAGPNRRAAQICVELAVANRYLGNAAELAKWSREAVERWEKSPDFPRELGTAYGLRGEARELEPALDAALQDHFHALELFRQAHSGLDVRRAYHHIFRLCLRANRLSEAAEAGAEIIGMAQQLGDLDDIQETAVPLAQAYSREGRLGDAMPFLELAERLTLEALGKDPQNRTFLEYRFQHLMWAARLLVARLTEGSALSAEQKGAAGRGAYERIENARLIALDLGRDELLAEAWLEHGLLGEAAGQFTAAVQACRALDFIKDCPQGLLAHSFLVQGRIAARQESFQEARDLLDYGLKTFDENQWDDIRVRFLNMRGWVKEKLGDQAGAIQDYEDAVQRTTRFRDLLAEESQARVYGMVETALDRLFSLNAEDSPLQDARRALYWAEFAKSRGLAELVGQSAFMLPQPSPETAALYEEERKLLAEVHAGRANAVAAAGLVSLDESYSMQTKKARLEELWNQLEVRHPEYVELRRGAVPSWSEIVEMTAG